MAAAAAAAGMWLTMNGVRAVAVVAIAAAAAVTQLQQRSIMAAAAVALDTTMVPVLQTPHMVFQGIAARVVLLLIGKEIHKMNETYYMIQNAQKALINAFVRGIILASILFISLIAKAQVAINPGKYK